MGKRRTIPVEESLLFRKLYRSERSLRSHLREYLKGKEDCLLVFQFAGHLPELSKVSESLRILSVLPGFRRGEEFAHEYRFSLVSVHEHDWLLEVIGTIAAAVAIYEFVESRIAGKKLPPVERRVSQRVRKTRKRTRTVVKRTPRQVGGQMFMDQTTQQVPYLEEYDEEVEEIQLVEASEIDGVTIEEADRVMMSVRRLEMHKTIEEIVSAEYSIEEWQNE